MYSITFLLCGTAIYVGRIVCAAWRDAENAPIHQMDAIALCLHPQAAADFVLTHAQRICPGALPDRLAASSSRKKSFDSMQGAPSAAPLFT